MLCNHYSRQPLLIPCCTLMEHAPQIASLLINLLQTCYTSVPCFAKGSSQWREVIMKTRNLPTKHALKNELEQVCVVRSQVLSPKVCFSMSLDQLPRQGGIYQEWGYQCVFYTKEQQLMWTLDYWHGNKVYAGPKMEGIQKIQFWYTNNRTDHQH